MDLTAGFIAGIITRRRWRMMPSKQSARQMKYAKESVKVYRLSLNVRTDADIIAKLDSLPSKQGYIKQLIRADMDKQKPNE